MSPMYFRGAAAAVLVYDVTQPATLDKVASWVEELQANTHSAASAAGGGEPDECVFIVAGNKSDLMKPAADASAATSIGQQQPLQSPTAATAAAVDFVDPHAALRYAATLNAHTFLTSAKTGAGVDALFQDLAQTLLARHQRKLREATVYAEPQASSRGRQADLSQAAPKQDGGCCS